jgi:hypothetical protein
MNRVSREALIARLSQLIRARFEPFTNVTLEHLARLEADLGLPSVRFTELLADCRFLLEEELNLKMSLLASDVETAESLEVARRRDWILGQIQQAVKQDSVAVKVIFE